VPAGRATRWSADRPLAARPTSLIPKSLRARSSRPASSRRPAGACARSRSARGGARRQAERSPALGLDGKHRIGAAPVPMNEYLSRYPEVSLQLRTGAARACDPGARRRARRRSGGGADRRRAVRENPDVRREAGDHRRRQASADQFAARRQRRRGAGLRGRLPLSSTPGYWFAASSEMSDRIIEMSSYHAMHGYAVAGMGIPTRSCSACMRCRRSSASLRRFSSGARARRRRRSSRFVGGRAPPDFVRRRVLKSSDCIPRPRDACAARRRPP
jgi:hypothetical protein